MSTVRRRTLVRAAAVTACAGALLAVPTAAALADGVDAASAAQHAGKPQRTLVRTVALADGVSRAKVYRIGDAYQADILSADGRKATTLTGGGSVTGVGRTGGLNAALQPDGRLSSWVGDTTPAGSGGHAVAGDGHKTGVRDGRVVPASTATSASAGTGGTGGTGTRAIASGPVDALRLNSVADGEGDGVLLLAAGGGIAAVGAAGLGFALLRRGRTDG